MSTQFSFYPMSFSAQDFAYPTGSKKIFNDFQLPKRRRDDTNIIISKLQEATCLRRPGEPDLLRFGGRKNKNEILGLTNARLIKEKYLNGDKYLRDVELCRGFSSSFTNGEFVLVLRTDGRIVAMTDDVENHLAKPMRCLYTQCTNIFSCLDQSDGERLRAILNDSSDEEHRLVCTLRLPKGKRPSRTREDVKTIVMTGHFYYSTERLFIARCEALVSCQSNGSSSSSTSPMMTGNTTKIVLNEDTTIAVLSSNAKDLFACSRNEILGISIGRFLTSESLKKFMEIREEFHFNEQLLPQDRYEILDFYGNQGARCLTFLCQIRPIRERRSKSLKFSIIAQLIDPSKRDDFSRNFAKKTDSASSSPRINPDLMVESPTVSRGLLMSELEIRSQQSSPCDRSFSSNVVPIFLDPEENFFQQTIEECSEKHFWNDDLPCFDGFLNDY